MARHGENIRKRKDGRWEGRYPVYNADKEKTVYRSVYGRTYEEAREKLTAKKNLMKGRCVETKKIYDDIIFLEAAREWLEHIKRKRKPSTYIKYFLIYRKHFEKMFAGIAVSEVTDAFVKENFPDNLSESMRKSIYCMLNQILKHAASQYSLTITTLKKPGFEKQGRLAKVLSKKEQKQIMAVLGQEMDLFKMAVMAVMFTGLRLGELCALKWTDIDFENKTITLYRTVQRLYTEGRRTKTALLETPPKSGHSRREIPLSAATEKLLIKFRSDREYVFGGDKPMEPRTMQYHFKKILREAGLPDANFHILRHTFATNCVECGVDVKSLSEILGHSDVQTTLNLYVHPSMDMKRRYMDSLLTFYGQIHGKAG